MNGGDAATRAPSAAPADPAPPISAATEAPAAEVPAAPRRSWEFAVADRGGPGPLRARAATRPGERMFLVCEQHYGQPAVQVRVASAALVGYVPEELAGEIGFLLANGHACDAWCKELVPGGSGMTPLVHAEVYAPEPGWGGAEVTASCELELSPRPGPEAADHREGAGSGEASPDAARTGRLLLFAFAVLLASVAGAVLLAR
jgi:hypothetical protein